MPSSPSTARKATAQLPPHLHDLEPFSSTSPTRFHSLYSDFARQKSSNPTSYQANVQWWRKGLESLVSSGRQATNSESNRFVLKANREFLERLRIEKLGKPMGLGTAIVRYLRCVVHNIGLEPPTTSRNYVNPALWYRNKHSPPLPNRCMTQVQ